MTGYKFYCDTFGFYFEHEKTDLGHESDRVSHSFKESLGLPYSEVRRETMLASYCNNSKDKYW